MTDGWRRKKLSSDHSTICLLPWTGYLWNLDNTFHITDVQSLETVSRAVLDDSPAAVEGADRDIKPGKLDASVC